MFSQLTYEGFGFAVEFIHSVNQSPVREFFEIRGGEIYLIAMEFSDFGAGMPSEPPPGTEILHKPCGTMRLIGFDQHIKHGLRYIVARATCICLYIQGKRFPLTDFAEPGTVIEFTAD